MLDDVGHNRCMKNRTTDSNSLTTGLILAVAIVLMGNTMPSQLINEFADQHPAAAPSEPPEIQPIEPAILSRGTDDQPMVALTFDACSTWAASDYDDSVIEILKEQQAPATLFLGGLWMLRHPEETRTLHESPLFEIANHAHSHPDMTKLEKDEIDRELTFTQLAALHLTGEQPGYFRPPYVRKNDKLVERAARYGMLTVQYDLASGDADENLSPEAIADNVLDNIRPGSIVVLHMNNPDLPTAEALPLILEGLRELELEPATVSQLLEAGASPERL